MKGNQPRIPAVLRPASSDPLTLNWDFDKRLARADVDHDSSADVTYQWDALGRRVGRDDGTSPMVYVQSSSSRQGQSFGGCPRNAPRCLPYNRLDRVRLGQFSASGA